ncbi:MAG: PKD domain-containing protein [Planctomycetota bacterium]
MKTTTMILALGVLVVAGAATAATTTQLSRFGITWTFESPVEYGQFANGDPWVVGPVRIVAINPPSTNVGGRTKHGSMINPSNTGMTQGYDSAMYAQYGPAYSASLNVALGVSAANPLTVPAGSSLISAISLDEAGLRPQLKTAAILTVLDAPAPAGSFRPPYFGGNKTIRYTIDQLDTSHLPRLAPVGGTPNLATVAGNFERPWLEHVLSWTGRYCHPADNMPDYGEAMALQLGDGLLSLCLDYTDAEKETLLVRLVQYGIDNYTIAAGGGVWEDLGGHMHGRKLPILLAGLVLGDADMLAIGSTMPLRFQEDRQTWIVTQDDVGRPLYHADGRPREEYIQADVGIPEWGEQHTKQPERDGRNWDAYYRTIVGRSILGHVLAANILDLRDAWQWEPLFLYIDRYWTIESPRTSGTHLIPTFHKNMWNAYRDTVHVPVHAEAGPDQVVDDTDGDGVEMVTLDGTGSSSPNDPITGYVWRMGETLLGTSAVQMTVLPVGVHTISLAVTDANGSSATDTVTITVRQVARTPGDADTDGDVDLDDFAVLKQHFGTTTGATWAMGDFDDDGDVDLDDFAALKLNFGATGR